jgi:intein-encoded DNA endonuclease-like protein
MLLGIIYLYASGLGYPYMLFVSFPDLRLLAYVKDLLRRLGIESTGPKILPQRGTIIHDRRKGKQYLRSKDVYAIYIRARSKTNFYRHVGFTIRRKQMRLESYVKRT